MLFKLFKLTGHQIFSFISSKINIYSMRRIIIKVMIKFLIQNVTYINYNKIYYRPNKIKLLLRVLGQPCYIYYNIFIGQHKITTVEITRYIETCHNFCLYKFCNLSVISIR